MRLAGLASGMDIEQMVKDLMRAERMPLDKLKQKKQVLEWQRDDYRSLNTKLASFRDKLSNLKLTSNYRARSVTSSNEAAASATVANGASQASYTISRVDSLATAATMISGENKGIDPTKSLGEIMPDPEDPAVKVWKTGVPTSTSIQIKESTSTVQLENMKDAATVSIKVNGKTVESKDYTIDGNGLITFNSPLALGATVKVDYAMNNKTVTSTLKEEATSFNIGAGSLNSATITLGSGSEATELTIADGKLYKEGTEIGSINLKTGQINFDPKIEADTEIKVEYTQSYSSFNISTNTSKGTVSEQIFFTENDTLNTVIRKVNDSGAGVTMFYDSFSGQTTLTRKETGKFSDLGKDITVGGDLMTKLLKFDPNAVKEGSNAVFTINGLPTERTSNTFDMNGVTITLKQETSSPITVSVGNDSSKVYDNIKEFVDQYNELIADIAKKLNEPKYRDYKPLTDDEREELSDKQIEKWEEMARSGNLKGDSVLSGVLSALRLDMGSTVETGGLYKTLASIGITTSKNYLEGGKLEINEAKLKEALEKDPDAVENIFRGAGEGSERGIVHKLYDTSLNNLNKLWDKAGRASSTNQQFAIGRALLDVDKGIDRFEDKMKVVENRYWRQFTAMEKAIQQANQQSSYLMQQFSMG